MCSDHADGQKKNDFPDIASTIYVSLGTRTDISDDDIDTPELVSPCSSVEETVSGLERTAADHGGL